MMWGVFVLQAYKAIWLSTRTALAPASRSKDYRCQVSSKSSQLQNDSLCQSQWQATQSLQQNSWLIPSSTEIILKLCIRNLHHWNRGTRHWNSKRIHRESALPLSLEYFFHTDYKMQAMYFTPLPFKTIPQLEGVFCHCFCLVIQIAPTLQLCYANNSNICTSPKRDFKITVLLTVSEGLGWLRAEIVKSI